MRTVSRQGERTREAHRVSSSPWIVHALSLRAGHHGVGYLLDLDCGHVRRISPTVARAVREAEILREPVTARCPCCHRNAIRRANEERGA